MNARYWVTTLGKTLRLEQLGADRGSFSLHLFPGGAVQAVSFESLRPFVGQTVEIDFARGEIRVAPLDAEREQPLQARRRTLGEHR